MRLLLTSRTTGTAKDRRCACLKNGGIPCVVVWTVANSNNEDSASSLCEDSVFVCCQSQFLLIGVELLPLSSMTAALCLGG